MVVHKAKLLVWQLHPQGCFWTGSLCVIGYLWTSAFSLWTCASLFILGAMVWLLGVMMNDLLDVLQYGDAVSIDHPEALPVVDMFAVVVALSFVSFVIASYTGTILICAVMYIMGLLYNIMNKWSPIYKICLAGYGSYAFFMGAFAGIPTMSVLYVGGYLYISSIILGTLIVDGGGNYDDDSGAVFSLLGSGGNLYPLVLLSFYSVGVVLFAAGIGMAGLLPYLPLALMVVPIYYIGVVRNPATYRLFRIYVLLMMLSIGFIDVRFLVLALMSIVWFAVLQQRNIVRRETMGYTV